MTEEPLLEFERGTNINPIQQWKDFTRELYELMMKVNSDALVNKHEWETPNQPGRKIDTIEIDSWVEYANYRNADSVKVYPFKKEGLRINVVLPSQGFGSKYSFSIIKSCKDDFHRDWEKDGICVQDVQREYQEYPRNWISEDLE